MTAANNWRSGVQSPYLQMPTRTLRRLYDAERHTVNVSAQQSRLSLKRLREIAEELSARGETLGPRIQR